jgi:peptidoglycan hydrolase FlgJ
MRQASFGDSLFGSDQQQFYQGMFDDQLAVELTKGKGLGLADMLVQQLTKSGLVPADATKEPGLATPSSAAGSAVKKGVLNFSAPEGAESNRVFPIKTNSGARKSDSASNSVSSPISNSVSSAARSPEEFVKELWPCAEEAGKELGVDPRHLLAQAALETGWGKSLPCDTNGNPSFNMFGIKAGESWTGDSVSVRTLEFEGGIPVPKHAKFRSYDSAAESFRDYVALLRDNPRYADALNTGSDAKAFATALQRGGYATDPAYARKLTAIAQNLAAHAPISETALKSSTEAPMTTTILTF